MCKDEYRYLKTLQRASRHTSFGKYKMIAGIWLGSTFLGWGENLYKNRRGGETINQDYAGKGLHAELSALSSLDCRRATMYVAGISKTGFEITSRPCSRCERLISNSSLLFVVYFDGEKLVKVRKDFFC